MSNTAAVGSHGVVSTRAPSDVGSTAVATLECCLVVHRVTSTEGEARESQETIALCVCQLGRKHFLQPPMLSEHALGPDALGASSSQTANETSSTFLYQVATRETRPTAAEKAAAPKRAGAVIRMELSAWKQHRATKRM